MVSLRKRILWRRALDWLKTYHPIVIAVTGTYGKSTAAAAIAKVVSTKYRTRWTPQSGADPMTVPLAILGVDAPASTLSWYQALTRSFTDEISEEEPEVLIIELPATAPGDLDWIGQRIAADITVVTNVGTANLDVFHSKENIVHEISSLIVGTKTTGTVVINYDDEVIRDMPTLTKAAAISFGSTAAADVQVVRANRLPAGGFVLEVRTHHEIAELHVPHIVARHQLSSLLAELAVGHALTISLAESARALQTFAALPGRTALIGGRNSATLIDDSANATPESMMQALETLRAVPARRRIAAIGDIAHLGRETERAHRKIGRLAAHTANIVIAVGENMRWAGVEVLQAGVDVHHFDKAEDAGKWLVDFLQSDDLILISGGWEMHMSTLVERLRAG